MSLQVNGQTLDTDEEGFLLDPAQWNAEVAQVIAQQEALPLDEQRWRIVRYIRDYFDAHQSVPEARTLLKNLKQTLGEQYATRRYLYQLFPYGYGQQACKIAGMRKPRKLMLDV